MLIRRKAMLIDSNILVYAVNKNSSKHKKAVSFLKNNESDLVISHQNILEALRVITHPKYSHPLNSQLAVKAVLLIADASTVISPNDITYPIFLDYIKKFNLSGNRIFDAYLAATALSNEIYEIATDNTKDFQKYSALKTFNPFN